MTDIQREIIRAMMDADGNSAKAARAIRKTRNAVCYHIDRIKEETGLDPRSFRDLRTLVEMAQSMDELEEDVTRCHMCGSDLDRQNIIHTRIVTCDGYKNTECSDVDLCVSCSAKVIAYAKSRRGDG